MVSNLVISHCPYPTNAVFLVAVGRGNTTSIRIYLGSVAVKNKGSPDCVTVSGGVTTDNQSEKLSSQ